jgi:hypothetical protein
MENAPKKKTVSGNFSYALFSLSDFFNLEDGTNILSQNDSEQLPFYAA